MTLWPAVMLRKMAVARQVTRDMMIMFLNQKADMIETLFNITLA